MKKITIKKYHLKKEVKTIILLTCLLIAIVLYLFAVSDRIERIENTGDTRQKSVNVHLINK